MVSWRVYCSRYIASSNASSVTPCCFKGRYSEMRVQVCVGLEANHHTKKRSWMACKRFIKLCRNRFMEWIKPQRWLRGIPFKHSIGNEKPHMTSGIFRCPLLQLQRWTFTSLSHQNSRSTLETLLTKCYITCESSAKTFRLLIIQLRREMLGRVLVHILDMHPAFQDALATPQALHTPIQRLRSPTPTKNSPKRAWQMWYIFKYVWTE